MISRESVAFSALLDEPDPYASILAICDAYRAAHGLPARERDDRPIQALWSAIRSLPPDSHRGAVILPFRKPSPVDEPGEKHAG